MLHADQGSDDGSTVSYHPIEYQRPIPLRCLFMVVETQDGIFLLSVANPGRALECSSNMQHVTLESFDPGRCQQVWLQSVDEIRPGRWSGQTQSFSFSMLAAEAFLPGSPLWQESHTPSKHAQATEQQNLKLSEELAGKMQGLLEERARLHLALHTIKEMTNMMSHGETRAADGEGLGSIKAARGPSSPVPEGAAAHRQRQPGAAAPQRGEAAERPLGPRPMQAEAREPQGSHRPRATGHPALCPEGRAKATLFYSLINPFETGSTQGAATPRSELEPAMIRFRQGDGRPRAAASPSTSQQSLDSTHRVAVAGTHVVDYVGSRPDATTEAAMDRILDQPLPTWDPEVGRLAGLVTPPRTGGHPSTAGASAPASVVSGPPSPCADTSGWAVGSLSLPPSTHVTPSVPESSRVHKGGPRPRRGVDLMPTTAAVAAMERDSPIQANAVAQLMSDQVSMRSSMPDGAWARPVRDLLKQQDPSRRPLWSSNPVFSARQFHGLNPKRGDFLSRRVPDSADLFL
ncbi:hypothetical protein ACKKBG_A26350 [Auxenochlorella protothecoides x Auxenochlorella symbiontica]